MVRINLIKPKLLLDQHLNAEWNEIQMLLGYVQKYPELDGTEPDSYKLGKGHIKFFKDKISYLVLRLHELKKEAELRGFNYQSISGLLKKYDIPKHLVNDYKPNKEAFKIIKERIWKKYMQKSDWYTYYGRAIIPDNYKSLLFIS